MPKVINQNGVSVDSLQAKLTLLETKFSKLSTEHKVVLDSLRNFDKALQKADIATTFYDTHLATYTTIFTVIVGLIATLLTVYNIFGIYNPIKYELKNLKDEELPKNLDLIRAENKDQIKELKIVNDELRGMAIDANSWALKGMVGLYENIKDQPAFVLFILRYAKHCVTYYDIEDNNNHVLIYLKQANLVISDYNVSISDLQNFKDELVEIFATLFSVDDTSIKEKAVECRNLLFVKNSSTVNKNSPTE